MKPKEKSDIKKNYKSTIFSHHGSIQVEMEDGTLKEVDLLSYIDLKSLKRRQMKAEKPAGEIQMQDNKR